jgi:hypothetical protein
LSAKSVLGPSVDGDNYPTPKAYITTILNVLHKDKVNLEGLLDPCCGAGNVLAAARAWGICAYKGIELSPGLAGQAHQSGFDVLYQNALGTDPWPSEIRTIVTNPPYSFAAEFVRRSFLHVSQLDGTVAMLLRLGFLASAKRQDLFDYTGMPDVYVVPRPSFCLTVHCKGCGYRTSLPPGSPRPKLCGFCKHKLTVSSTDSADYAWMVWHTSRRGASGTVRRLTVPT